MENRLDHLPPPPYTQHAPSLSNRTLPAKLFDHAFTIQDLAYLDPCGRPITILSDRGLYNVVDDRPYGFVTSLQTNNGTSRAIYSQAHVWATTLSALLRLDEMHCAQEGALMPCTHEVESEYKFTGPTALGRTRLRDTTEAEVRRSIERRRPIASLQDVVKPPKLTFECRACFTQGATRFQRIRLPG
ncbi:hypothetical protein BDZ85DRAFT_29147 [Elsinoe ampelina]|uniref:Uncharacterized protein n=1 Tax=Elsinoe ampelina TaxID=302913 RepID=A0A6A6G4G0_9PEZI|nr:hypothetical protein BDZ85DRAFT_29147 [Elsinoe ampelina]